MARPTRKSQLVSDNGVEIEVYVDGDGPTFVILPSYGRDSGDDYDDIAARLADAGWRVLRPQPRGIAGSKGPMSGVSLHDLASDVALSIRAAGIAPAVVLGHAFGNLLARMLATDFPASVRAVVLAAAQATKVSEDIATAPFVAGDTSASQADRLAALRMAFFAPNHDASIWLGGWYPKTLAMQRAANEAVALSSYWKCGSVPLLELIAEDDPFKPKEYWQELHTQLGARVTTAVINDAGHALFPEQPVKVAAAILPWAAHFHGDA